MRNIRRGAIKSADWYQELLKDIFNVAVGLILTELVKRITRHLRVNKRPVLTLAGVAYVGWLVFGFLIWLAGTFLTARGPYSVGSFVSYLMSCGGLLLLTGFLGVGLNRLAFRIDPSHWTARMTKGFETRKREPRIVKDTLPSYIQQAPLIRPVRPFESSP